MNTDNSHNRAARGGFAKVGLDGRFLKVDAELQTVLDHDTHKLTRLRFHDITHPDDLLRDEANLEAVLSKGRGQYSMMKRYVRRDGRTFWAQLDVSLECSLAGEPHGFCVQIMALDMDKTALDDIHDRAVRDPLTRLYNRTTLDEQLMTWVLRARRLGKSFTVFMLDLDQFKQVNDSFGHAEGDTLLKAFAARISATLAPGDLAARVGGDEVVILSPDLQDKRAVARKMTVIQAALAAPFHLTGGPVRIGASCGAATFPHDGDRPAQLLHHADMQMLAAKHQRGGR